MNLATLDKIVAMSQCIHYNFHHTTFHILRDLDALHRFFIPKGTIVATDEEHGVFKKSYKSACNLCAVESIDASFCFCLAVPSCAEHTALAQWTFVCHQQTGIGKYSLIVNQAKRTVMFFVETKPIPGIVAAAKFGKCIIFKHFIAWACIE